MALFSKKQKAGRPVPAPSTPSAAPASPAQPSEAVEARIRELGEDMLRRAREGKAGIFSSRFYSDKLMNWSMKDHNFKVQLFRFVDCYPMLTTSEMVHEHLADYLSQPGVKTPPGLDLGLKAGGIAKGLMSNTISSQIKSMASKFIAGADAADALPGLKKLWDRGIAFSVDLLGEACVSDAEADDYKAKYLDLIENLPSEVASWPSRPLLETDHLGDIPRTNVSVKISSLSARSEPIDTEGAIRDLMSRLLPILETARDKGVFINFDMEQFELKDLTLELFKRCCEKIDFHAGLAMQAYLKSGVEDAKNIAGWAASAKRAVTVRLVKGAYWDFETIHAEQMGWPCPVWNEKWQTDRCFEDMTSVFLDACPKSASEGGVKLALGSHNVRSIARAITELERRSLPHNAIELQMLHGMADELKAAGNDMGLRVREYVPVGEMIPGMAYLVRRLLENTSNESWLKAGFLDNADSAELLRPPAPKTHAIRTGTTTGGPNGAPVSTEKRDLYEIAPERHQLSPAEPKVGDGRPFNNEPLRDFSQKTQRDAFAKAIASARVRAVASDKTVQDAERAITQAYDAFPAWRDTDPLERARVLTKAADAMRKRRDELSGMIIKENGKGWVDADADVAEAIDFCEYYARFAPQLFRRERIGRYIGELDEQWYQPRGVAAVISPWNFPLAIASGMTVAALVTGNTAILKPAEQTAGIAAVFADILWEAGCPREVFHFLPAPGETVGAALVRDPRIALLAFTGSKAVGLDIIKAAGVTHEEQHHVKKVVCEMGGKNALIIDISADLDEAVLGVRHSAFGFQGQKCSACSRCIVVDPDGPDGHHTQTFIRRLVEASRSLVVGDPIKPGTDVGPVIDEGAFDKITSMIRQAKEEGCVSELQLDPTPLEPNSPSPKIDSDLIPRHFVGPHIFSRVAPHHTLAREEVFGPVLAVMHARSFDEALKIANDHPYKLTGGVFSRKPANLEKAKREFRVGNLYLNRGITGAMVARQPFGGFGMSGVGSKAGGRDYLLQFVEPRASCENTMRRGFAPEL